RIRRQSQRASLCHTERPTPERTHEDTFGHPNIQTAPGRCRSFLHRRFVRFVRFSQAVECSWKEKNGAKFACALRALSNDNSAMGDPMNSWTRLSVWIAS